MIGASDDSPSGSGRRGFAIASFQTLLGASTSRVLVFGLAIATARILGSEAYGEFSIIQSTVLLLAIALGQPLGVVLNRYAAALRVNEPSRTANLAGSLISTTVFASLAAAVGLYLASPSLAEDLFNRPRLAPLLAISGIAVVLQVLCFVVLSTLRGFHEFKTAASVQALHALVGVPLALLMVWEWGLTGAVFGLIGFWAIGAGLGVFGTLDLSKQRNLRFRLVPRLEDLRLVGPFYLPYLATILMVVFSNWFIRALLARGEDAYRQVGLFSAAFQYAQISQLIIVPLMMVATPTLTAAWSRPQHIGFRSAATDLLKASLLLLIPLTLLAVGCAPWMLSLLGPDYRLALRPIEFLFPAIALNSLNSLAGPVLLATERVSDLARLTFVRVSLLITLTLALRGSGAEGAALAFLLTEIAVAGGLVLVLVKLREAKIASMMGRISLFSVPGLLLGAWSLLLGTPARPLLSGVAAAMAVIGAVFALEKADRSSLRVLVLQAWPSQSDVKVGSPKDERKSNR